MFNKRHYEAIAEIMQHHCPYPKIVGNDELNAAWIGVRNELADMFARDNSRFQRERFLAACQPGANVKLRTRYKIAKEWNEFPRTGEAAEKWGR